MSLQVWLPLNGNLKNQGLDSDLGFIDTASATVSTDGKIGSCYSFSDTSGNGLLLYSGKSPSEFMNAYINHHSWSLCAWVRTTSDSTVVFGLTGGINLWCGVTNCVSLSSNERTVSAYNNASVADGKWHHICATYNTVDNAVNVYIDGVKGATEYYPAGETYASPWRGAVAIGKNADDSIASPYYYFQGSMNDARIYDHCLSAKEVKEISKGLICHYKLDNNGFGNPNLITTMTPGGITTLNGKYGLNADFAQGTDTYGFFNVSPALELDSTYTLSFDVSNFPAGSAWNFLLWNNANYNIGTITKDGHYTYTFVPSESKLPNGYSLTKFLFDDGNCTNPAGMVYFTNFKIEKGSVATSWCPHTSDSLYTSLGLDSTTELDCSGYGYNGTLSESLPYASGSPRYDGCYYFNSTSKRITLPAINMSGFSNSFSISWWGKAPSYPDLMYWGFSDGNRLNYYSGMYCNTRDGSSNPYYKPNTTTTVSTPSVDTWHHFVMVGDGSSNKLYMDGELYGVAKTYKGITGSTIVINGWDSSTNYKTNGYISDFRIYSTALSASDIKELYNTSASVDKNGNMYAYEFKEV